MSPSLRERNLTDGLVCLSAPRAHRLSHPRPALGLLPLQGRAAAQKEPLERTRKVPRAQAPGTQTHCMNWTLWATQVDGGGLRTGAPPVPSYKSNLLARNIGPDLSLTPNSTTLWFGGASRQRGCACGSEDPSNKLPRLTPTSRWRHVTVPLRIYGRRVKNKHQKAV